MPSSRRATASRSRRAFAWATATPTIRPTARATARSSAAEGAFGLDHVLGELGDVLVGKVPGRTSAEDVTVFDSAGTALLDIACAKIALDAAARRGLGTVAEL